ncbi:MAG: hypothetical protein Q7R94_02195, partial [bacterium]|nr:hypothetical protein [bacterium]
MAESNGENFWVAGAGGSSGPVDLGPGVPPPPPEVKIRTLKSDLESMAESGGGQPQFKSVKAPMIPLEDMPKVGGVPSKMPSVNIGTIVVIVVAIILVAIIVFFGYKLFFVNQVTGPVPANPSPSALSPTTAPPPPANIAGATFVHKTYFQKAVDQFLTLTIRTEATNAADLETFSQKLTTLLSAQTASGSFFEVSVRGADGRDLDAQKIFDAADIAVVDRQFFPEHFLSDTTFFVYKNTNGFWPGFVLSLKPGDNWLFVKNDVAKLETSPKLVNFFLTSPGNADARGFQDTTEDGQPARKLQFNLSA